MLANFATIGSHSISAWLLVIVISISSCSVSLFRPQKGSVRMDDLNRVTVKLSELGDDVYFRRDPKVATTIPLLALESGFKGLALGAPKVVQLDTHNVLPTLLVESKSEVRSDQVPLSKNAIAVAANIESGSIVLGTAFPGDPSKSPEDQPNSSSPRSGKVEAPTAEEVDDPDKEGDGDEAGAAWLDFRELLDLPWRPAQLALRVIAFDEVSNPVFVTLGRDATMGVEFFPSDVAGEIVRRNKGAVDRGQGLPQFTRSHETPRLDSIGIALTLGKVRTRAGEPVPVHSALRMELSFQSIVKHSKDSGAKKVDAQSTLPAAVVKAALLVTIRNMNRPARIDVDIPIWSDKRIQAGDVVDCAFSLDLATALPMELVPGNYCVYLLAGPYLSGPHKLEVEPGK